MNNKLFTKILIWMFLGFSLTLIIFGFVFNNNDNNRLAIILFMIALLVINIDARFKDIENKK